MSLPNELLPVGLLATGDTQYRIERSLRFNSTDSAYLSRTPASAGNRQIFTWSGWIKRSAFGVRQNFFQGGNHTAGSNSSYFEFGSSDVLRVAEWNGSSETYTLESTQVFRDSGAWLHLLVAFDTTQATASNRIKVYVNGAQITVFATANYPVQNANTSISNNVIHNIGRDLAAGASYFSGYLADIHFIDGQALTPSSFAETNTTTGQWVPKAYRGTYGTNGFRLAFADNSSNTATTLGKDTSGNGNNWTPNNLSVGFNSNVNYSDSATLTGTYSPTGIKRIFDDSLTTSASNQSHSNPSNAFQTVTFGTPFTSVTSVRVYGYNGDSGGTTNLGYRINNVAYQAAANPGDSALAWQNLSGQLASTGNVVSSVSVQWSGNSTNATRDVGPYAIEINGVVLVDKGLDLGNDSLVDTPTSYGTDTGAGGSVRGNYPVWNALDTANSEAVLSNGNLDINWSNTSGHARKSTFAMRSGKWYCEITRGSSSVAVGLILSSISALPTWPGSSVYGAAGSYSYNSTNGNKRTNGSLESYGNTFATGDVIGIAFDADNGKLWFSKNGTWQASGDPAAGTNAAFTGITGEYCFVVGYYDAPTGGTNLSANFGQRPFAYTAPSGFKALCDTNLPTPTIAKPNTAFDVVLYTGNGSSSRSITGLQFSPDFIWGKERNSANWHNLVDIVRGASKRLYSNSTTAEEDVPTSFISFDSGGFTIGNDNATNENNAPYVAWAWDAGSSTTTNTQGSITSSVRANPSAGFSIVTWTQTGSSGDTPTVGHGLGVTPSMFIIKTRSNVQNWFTYHVSLGVNQAISLNTTGASVTVGNPPAWSVSSSTFGCKNGEVVDSGQNFVAYCFAPVAGYSAFGSYTGNGSADGPFVYTSGFRSRWVLIKNASATENWYLVDTARDLSNPSGLHLYPNLSNAEFSPASSFPIDILSNGFKVRTASAGWNTNGQTYIYAAFAESPFQYSRAR